MRFKQLLMAVVILAGLIAPNLGRGTHSASAHPTPEDGLVVYIATDPANERLRDDNVEVQRVDGTAEICHERAVLHTGEVTDHNTGRVYPTRIAAADPLPRGWYRIIEEVPSIPCSGWAGVRVEPMFGPFNGLDVEAAASPGNSGALLEQLHPASPMLLALKEDWFRLGA